MPTSYADSAQAREWDRRFDEWGRPRPCPQDFTHEYDAEARRAQEANERASLKRRIEVAITEMEKVCQPAGGSA